MSLHHYYQPSTAPFRRSVGGSGAVGNDAYTTVLLHFDGADASTTMTDSNFGGSAHTWTAAGNAQLDTESKFGSASLQLDGTGDYISTPDHADFFFGAGDYTIDFWFNRNGGNGSFRTIAYCQHSESPFRAWEFQLTSGNVVRFISYYPSLGTVTLSGTTAFTATGWHHVEVVRNGVNLTLYVDGVQEATNATLSTHAILNSDGVLYIGAEFDGGGQYYNGWLDEFRISKGIARHTAGFTPPTGAYGP
jgi:hypothetical protein